MTPLIAGSRVQKCQHSILKEPWGPLLQKHLPGNWLPAIHLTMLSHQYPEAVAARVQRVLDSISADIRPWCFHMMLVLLASESMTEGAGEFPLRFHSKDQEARQGAPDRAVHEAVGMKLKVKCRHQEARPARNVEC